MIVDRVVIDTSILISAALSPAGKPAAVVDQIVANGTLVFSAPSFDELSTRLFRPKFDRYLQPGEREIFLDRLSTVATWVTIAGGLGVCRDPNDDMNLETALVADARYIVTGDQDLLVLNPFRGIEILSAAEMVDLAGVTRAT